MAMGRVNFAWTARIISTRSFRRSRGRWLMLRRKTSAPASNSLAIISGLSEAGPKVARIFVRRARLMSLPPWAVRFGQLDRPALLSPGIDFEEAAAIEAPGEAILRAANGEFPLARAHEGASAPLAAPVVIDGVHIIESPGELPLEKGFAPARRQVPP